MPRKKRKQRKDNSRNFGGLGTNRSHGGKGDICTCDEGRARILGIGADPAASKDAAPVASNSSNGAATVASNSSNGAAPVASRSSGEAAAPSDGAAAARALQVQEAEDAAFAKQLHAQLNAPAPAPPLPELRRFDVRECGQAGDCLFVRSPPPIKSADGLEVSTRPKARKRDGRGETSRPASLRCRCASAAALRVTTPRTARC